MFVCVGEPKIPPWQSPLNEALCQYLLIIEIFLFHVYYLILYLWTVNIEPPVTDEILLVKHCSIGTQETVLDEALLTITCTNMIGLTSWLLICIVSWHVSITNKSGLWGTWEYWIVISRFARNSSSYKGNLELNTQINLNYQVLPEGPILLHPRQASAWLPQLSERWWEKVILKWKL